MGAMPPVLSVLRLIPDAQVEVLPGQGHMVQLEAAERVNQLMAAFLKSQP